MLLPDKRILNWLILLIFTLLSMGLSLYGYNQIINIPPLTTLEVKRPYEKTIFILKPKARQEIKNPVEISGKGKTSEGVLMILIKDLNNNILQKSTIEAMKAQAFLPFSITAPFQKPTTPSGIIEAFEYFPKEDRIDHKTAIPIIFAQ